MARIPQREFLKLEFPKLEFPKLEFLKENSYFCFASAGCLVFLLRNPLVGGILPRNSRIP